MNKKILIILIVGAVVAIAVSASCLFGGDRPPSLLERITTLEEKVGEFDLESLGGSLTSLSNKVTTAENNISRVESLIPSSTSFVTDPEMAILGARIAGLEALVDAQEVLVATQEVRLLALEIACNESTPDPEPPPVDVEGEVSASILYSNIFSVDTPVEPLDIYEYEGDIMLEVENNTNTNVGTIVLTLVFRTTDDIKLKEASAEGYPFLWEKAYLGRKIVVFSNIDVPGVGGLELAIDATRLISVGFTLSFTEFEELAEADFYAEVEVSSYISVP